MNISKKSEAKKIKIGKTMVAWEYPLVNQSIHGAVVELSGRYPEKGRVVNEKVTEIGFVLEGSGKLVIEGKEINFKKGDQLVINPGEKYFWQAKAKIFMPCAPAWYPEQHKEVN